MAFRIFNNIDMIVILNDHTWAVEKFEKGGIWYDYNQLEAPIIYSIYQQSPERPLVLDQPYTAFRKENGEAFDNDIQLQNHLDEVLGSRETQDLDTINIGGSETLLVTDRKSDQLLEEILAELKAMNKMFNILFHDQL